MADRHRRLVPDQVQPLGVRGLDFRRVDLIGQPLGVAVVVRGRQMPQDVVRAVPVIAGAVGEVHRAVVPGPARAGQGQVQRVSGGVLPPGGVVEIHVQQVLGEIHELEHVLGPVFPVADALVAGAVGAQDVHGCPELLDGHADPEQGVVRFVEHRQTGGAEAADAHPQVILHVQVVPPEPALGRHLEHGGAARDEGAADSIARGLVQVVIAPVVDQGQAEELMTGRQVGVVPAADAPLRIAARGQGPAFGGFQVPRLAGQTIGHGQVRHGVADGTLPELPGIAGEALYWGGLHRDQTVGPVLDLRPQTRVGRLNGLPQFLDALRRSGTAGGARPGRPPASSGRLGTLNC